MKLNPIIFGSTGMLGQAVLSECLSDTEVESVLIVNRRKSNFSHPKVREIVHPDLFNLTPIAGELSGFNTCFFCLGVSSAGMSEKEYHKTTYELTLLIAETLLHTNEEMTLCFVSGTGTDSSEQGKVMWARVKGKTENALLAMPFKKAYMFRPAYIQPAKGIKSRTPLYNVLYAITTPFYFLLKHSDRYVTNTGYFAKAMLLAARYGYEKNILENTDINRIVRLYQGNKSDHPGAGA